jgi:hypothetical protein
MKTKGSEGAMKKLFFTLMFASAIAVAVPMNASAAGARGRLGYHAGPRFAVGYYNPFWYGPRWGGYYGYYGYGYPYAIDNHGSLRLEVSPKTAQVFVDGSYAGVVDQFDGHFHHLDLTPGGHRIEVRQPGFQPLTFQAYIQPGHTTDFKRTLSPAPGA